MNTRGTLLFEHFPHALDSTVGGATGGLLVVEHSGGALALARSLALLLTRGALADVLLVPFGASFEDRYVGMPLPVAAEQLPNSGALGRISCTDVELRFEPSGAPRLALAPASCGVLYRAWRSLSFLVLRTTRVCL